MAIKVAGELTPNTVAGILADTTTIIDRENGNKRQGDINAETIDRIGDKSYIADSGNGMGRIVLKKSQTFGSQLTQTNTVYIIQDDFKLEDVTDYSTEITSGTSVVISGTTYYYSAAVAVANGQRITVLTEGCILINGTMTEVLGTSFLNTGEATVMYIATATQPTGTMPVTYNMVTPNATVNIPVNCVLKFEGGSVYGGTLQGDNTKIDAGKDAIFNGISILGSWNIPDIYSSWFADAQSDNKLKDVFKLTNTNVHNNVIIDDGTYNVSLVTGSDKILSVKDNTDVVLRGKIKLAANDAQGYFIVSIEGDNISFCGGEIEGDVATHTGVGGEWGMGISINSSNNVTVEDVVVHSCWGDSIYILGDSTNVNINNFTLHDSRRQGISIVAGKYIHISNGYIYNITGTDPRAAIDIEPNNEDSTIGIIIENLKVRDCYSGIIVNGMHTDVSVDNVTLRNIDIDDVDILGVAITDTDSNILVENSSINATLRAVAVSNSTSVIKYVNDKIKSLDLAVFSSVNTGKLVFDSCDIKTTGETTEEHPTPSLIRLSDNVSFLNCKMLNNGDLVWNLPTTYSNVLIDNCYIDASFNVPCENSIVRGSYIKTVVFKSKFIDTVLDGCTIGAMVLSEFSNSTVKDCTLASISDKVLFTKTTITDCIVHHTNSIVFNGDGNIVSGCSFSSDAGSIYFQGCESISVKGNDFACPVVVLLNTSEDGNISISENTIRGEERLMNISGSVYNQLGSKIDVHGNNFIYTKPDGTAPTEIVQIAVKQVDFHDNTVSMDTEDNNQVVVRNFSNRPISLYNNKISLSGGATKYVLCNERDSISYKACRHNSTGNFVKRPAFGKYVNTYDVQCDGASYMDNTLKKMIYWDCSTDRWVDSNGFSAIASKGATADRPVGEFSTRSGSADPSGVGTGIYVGYTFLNTTSSIYKIASAISGNTITWQDEDTFAGKTIPVDTVREGTSAQRPVGQAAYDNLYVGFEYHDTTLGEYIYISTLERTGSGTEESPYAYIVEWSKRPVHSGLSSANDVMFCYYDTTLEKYIYATEINASTGVVTWKTAGGEDPDA